MLRRNDWRNDVVATTLIGAVVPDVVREKQFDGVCLFVPRLLRFAAYLIVLHAKPSDALRCTGKYVVIKVRARDDWGQGQSFGCKRYRRALRLGSSPFERPFWRRQQHLWRPSALPSSALIARKKAAFERCLQKQNRQ